LSIVSETQVKEMMKMVKIEETIKEPEPPKKEVKVKLTSKLAIPSKQAPQARV
jgi:hypothetical protein